MLGSTSWTYTISYGGFTSPTINLAGSVTTAVLPAATVPGTYTFTAVTSYVSYNPSAAPPPPTTMTGSFTIAPPDTAAKGGAINTPTMVGTAAQISDPLYAAGQPIGSNVAGTVQNHIPTFTYYDGTQGGTGSNWYPAVTSTSSTSRKGRSRTNRHTGSATSRPGIG